MLQVGTRLPRVSVTLGFLFVSPAAPHQFPELVVQDVSPPGLSSGATDAGLNIIFLPALESGRFFSRYLCPVGALPEQVSLVLLKKIQSEQKHASIAVHAIVFRIIIILAHLIRSIPGVERVL